jgi:hypothetical protein
VFFSWVLAAFRTGLGLLCKSSYDFSGYETKEPVHVLLNRFVRRIARRSVSSMFIAGHYGSFLHRGEGQEMEKALCRWTTQGQSNA